MEHKASHRTINYKAADLPERLLLFVNSLYGTSTALIEKQANKL
jgi:hypothetical protein